MGSSFAISESIVVSGLTKEKKDSARAMNSQLAFSAAFKWNIVPSAMWLHTRPQVVDADANANAKRSRRSFNIIIILFMCGLETGDYNKERYCPAQLVDRSLDLKIV
jgi:hypothetical protein